MASLQDGISQALGLMLMNNSDECSVMATLHDDTRIQIDLKLTVLKCTVCESDVEDADELVERDGEKLCGLCTNNEKETHYCCHIK